MANTRTYASPLYTRPLPDLETCTDADILDLSAQLLAVPSELPADHVQRLCRLVETLHCHLDTTRSQLEVAHGLGQEMRMQLATAREQLAAERETHQRTAAVLEQQIRDASLQQVRLAAAQTEAANAAALDAKLRQAVLAITNRTAESIQAEFEAIADAEQADIRRRMDQREYRASRVRAAYESQDLLFDTTDVTDVVDVEGFDEPSVARTPTPRVVVASMAEIVGGAA